MLVEVLGEPRLQELPPWTRPWAGVRRGDKCPVTAVTTRWSSGADGGGELSNIYSDTGRDVQTRLMVLSPSR